MSAVGIVSYGAYLPRFSIAAEEIARGSLQTDAGPALGVKQKTVPGVDEDTATIATAAAQQALERAGSGFQIDSIRGVWVGSESHPYAVKPTGTIVAAALGLSNQLSLADLQFACKAGTAGLQIALAYAAAGWGEHFLAIGTDTAQARPGDVLEFTAAAGGMACLVGRDNLIAELIGTVSVATDTTDFWRRPGRDHPEHAGRFTGGPAYFAHIEQSVSGLNQQLGMAVREYDHCVFHTPNGKFPRQIAAQLGCSPPQVKHSLIVEQIGNTYAAASLLAFASVLDHAKTGEKILLASYGSGAGSDAFAFRVTAELTDRRGQWNNLISDQIKRLQPIDYAQYRARGGE
jgi:hydroxymethylglutaryl-CoA synthase